MINIPKGTKDALPTESHNWQYIERTAREVADLFGADEIRTPIFEHTEVFLRGVGETTDIVNKEMYTFNDKGGRSITLKPEGTAGVARSFIENGMTSQALPVKMYYITPCFRYERPQAGRLREFHQFGVEFLGSTTPDIDAETIILAQTFLSKLGVKDFTLYINSIGCRECRREYEKALKAYLNENYDKLCELCKDRLEKNPLRIFDCKNDECKVIVNKAPKILDYLCDDCKLHFEKLQKYLTTAGVNFEIDANIVRGLDYYTRTVFEFVSNSVGAQGTICGGGRYDGLIKELGGSDVAGMGFAIGLERLMLLMRNTGVKFEEKNKIKVYFAPMGEASSVKTFELTSALRKAGVKCDTDHMNRGIKAQFKYADKIGAEYVGVVGQDELDNGVVKIKNMADGSEKTISFDKVVEFFTK